MTNQPAAAGSLPHDHKYASARLHSHAREQALLDTLENIVASAAVTGLVDDLRNRGFSDAYVAASLLAAAKSLIRTQPNPAPWAALLANMATETSNGR
ncbi:hypothetical protein EN851_03390 [Mesorhizobium sp. M8A.F.Ca.ET.208.01.1.1]|uniref:hypothetical protein n=1 Tax=unclassified Mesorhizobium TaxID=325217 RepID=UPI0010938FF5|nr:MULTISPECIES: hypothetical protein [unclassified Mesorhizobium]TGQ94612.1 hypothetical protein EN851_03390 [Mesorhizobium sp. M8A.F.Ca.ET.208.01.1.1]TGT55100.1 hypothetical protein EN810_03390 [Mesorhizobium sp. M8A.F.Ca.ET.167.01.1.1]